MATDPVEPVQPRFIPLDQPRRATATRTPFNVFLQTLDPVTFLQTPTSVTPANDTFDITAVLSLSPEAQQQIEFFEGALSALQGGPVLSEDIGFVLTEEQQKKIRDIIARYKDAPFTVETYRQILDNLMSAGLAPAQILAENRTRQLSLAQIFLAALNGENPDLPTVFPSTNEQEDIGEYTRFVFTEWERLSTTFDANFFAAFLFNPDRQAA